MAEEIFEKINTFLPKYLSPSQSRELFDALSKYPDIGNHYLPPTSLSEDLLQGDGWAGLEFVEFDTGQRRCVEGLILSNSCDIDVSNFRASERRILFAPLIPLGSYELALREGGLDGERLQNVLLDIRRQHITYIYYLPAGTHGPDESIILLDDIHSEPLNFFLAGRRSRVFRLNQVAWYVLLIKISIHFSRVNEAVQRFPLGPTGS